ncbi:DUF1203 domain-containing protein [Serratia marcescens]|uniref:DUF1203 domain-containing protein n=1 Tax=Serratia marcescens TaxID=615 RepID=UPI0018D5B614|nr:DUF1203 domain-containing protein [Serratia marcescens]
MEYKISGLKAEQFTHLFGQSESYLKRYGAVRQTVNSNLGYPDRISLRNIPTGENSILINHIYQPADTPYFGSHAIYIWEGCNDQGIYVNELPEVMTTRLLSLRAYDEEHFLRQADICEGKCAESLICRFFKDSTISYIHIHNAKHGCYSCLCERIV